MGFGIVVDILQNFAVVFKLFSTTFYSSACPCCGVKKRSSHLCQDGMYEQKNRSQEIISLTVYMLQFFWDFFLWKGLFHPSSTD